MNSVFITGIPTAGKSHLAKKVAETLGISWIKMDNVRDEMLKDPKIEPWVNFFWNIDETKYYPSTPADIQWQNIVNQSEAFWPRKKQRIEETLAQGTPTIFEGVNLLPHLMKQLPVRGVVLLGTSEKETFKRLKAEPRWGNTEELQRLEADAFFNIERPHYAEEAKKYGYPAFSEPSDAEAELIKLIQQTA